MPSFTNIMRSLARNLCPRGRHTNPPSIELREEEKHTHRVEISESYVEKLARQEKKLKAVQNAIRLIQGKQKKSQCKKTFATPVTILGFTSLVTTVGTSVVPIIMYIQLGASLLNYYNSCVNKNLSFDSFKNNVWPTLCHSASVNSTIDCLAQLKDVCTISDKYDLNRIISSWSFVVFVYTWMLSMYLKIDVQLSNSEYEKIAELIGRENCFDNFEVILEKLVMEKDALNQSLSALYSREEGKRFDEWLKNTSQYPFFSQNYDARVMDLIHDYIGDSVRPLRYWGNERMENRRFSEVEEMKENDFLLQNKR